ncbi:hypothetical protein Pcinc_028026 [Petrolisthes cinctipes]|uniref:Transcription termination factor 2 n=1 Tax=Petrolisthes cinctipes TaxID=88211 RepID=A0AAE1F3X9_PETCI|nr:hypothetical protein Pcinc_028026 [Petrolisthes cinctipes]
MDSTDSSPEVIPGTPDAASGSGNTDDTTTPPVGGGVERGGGGGRGGRWVKPRRLHQRLSPNREPSEPIMVPDSDDSDNNDNNIIIQRQQHYCGLGNNNNNNGVIVESDNDDLTTTTPSLSSNSKKYTVSKNSYSKNTVSKNSYSKNTVSKNSANNDDDDVSESGIMSSTPTGVIVTPSLYSWRKSNNINTINSDSNDDDDESPITASRPREHTTNPASRPRKHTTIPASRPRKPHDESPITASRPREHTTIPASRPRKLNTLNTDDEDESPISASRPREQTTISASRPREHTIIPASRPRDQQVSSQAGYNVSSVSVEEDSPVFIKSMQRKTVRVIDSDDDDDDNEIDDAEGESDDVDSYNDGEIDDDADNEDVENEIGDNDNVESDSDDDGEIDDDNDGESGIISSSQTANKYKTHRQTRIDVSDDNLIRISSPEITETMKHKNQNISSDSLIISSPEITKNIAKQNCNVSGDSFIVSSPESTENTTHKIENVSSDSLKISSPEVGKSFSATPKEDSVIPKALSSREKYGHKFKIKKKSSTSAIEGPKSAMESPQSANTSVQPPGFDTSSGSMVSGNQSWGVGGSNSGILEFSGTSVGNISGVSVGNVSGRSLGSALSTTDMTTQEMQEKLKQNQLVLRTANLCRLPDKGAKIKQQIQQLQDALANITINDSIQSVHSDGSPNSSTNIFSASDTSLHNTSTHNYKYNTSTHSNTHNTSTHSYTHNTSTHTYTHNTSTHIRSEEAATLKAKKTKLKELKMMYSTAKLHTLEDGGTRLKKRITELEKEIMMFEMDVSPSELIIVSGPEHKYKQKQSDLNGAAAANLVQPQYPRQQQQHLSHNVIQELYSAVEGTARNYGGKISSARERQLVRVTSEAVEALHRALRSAPDLDEGVGGVEGTEEEPQGLKVQLMDHQRQALTWLLWRESQLPPGGILADDMGLGKTLTMISLMLKHRELVEEGTIPKDFSALKKDERDSDQEEEEEDLGWIRTKGGSRSHSLVPSLGTLVVCPASLLGQWEGEVKRHVSRGKMNVYIYHGATRESSDKRLARYDMVVTTYTIVMKEGFPGSKEHINVKNKDDIPKVKAKNQGSLFRVGWTRIILDEAHIIRNHRSKTSQAVCMLRGGRRWALTGTPVHNQEMDLYSLVRYLRTSPFDDYTCWKLQVCNNSAQGARRLAMLVKVLMLRRVKDQVNKATGQKIVELPEKTIIHHDLSLSQKEREVYDQVFIFSRSALVQYMKTAEEKEREKAEKWPSKQKEQEQQQQQHSVDDNKYTPTLATTNMCVPENVKSHHILVLLLRLRQICCHPTLIHKMLDTETHKTELKDLQDEENELDLITHMANMSITNKSSKEEGEEEMSTPHPEKGGEEATPPPAPSVLSADNPVFKETKKSSKIRTLLKELKKIDNDDKSIVVSQWTSMLEIVSEHLTNADMKWNTITGKVLVKDRADIVYDFNNNPHGAKVMLLSLGAGGVGLNLIGANHLFLIDIHWNPQLETQACDRIYRVGQTKPVYIHRFIVENTVEHKILDLQKKKLQISKDVLSGAKRTKHDKLTLDDIKTLFSVT